MYLPYSVQFFSIRAIKTYKGTEGETLRSNHQSTFSLFDICTYRFAQLPAQTVADAGLYKCKIAMRCHDRAHLDKRRAN